MSTRRPNQWVKLTKTAALQAAPPASGQAFVRDAIIKGFALRITAQGAKSFIVERRVEGQVKRLTPGRFGELTVEQVRKEALKLIGKIALGVNPLAEREHARLAQVTLERAFEDFKRARKDLKPRTFYDYGRLLEVAFAGWRKRPLTAISKDLVVKRHTELGKASGKAYANLAMRFLRSVFNFALAHYEDGFRNPLLTANPVQRLTQTRAWYRSERRQSSTTPRPNVGAGRHTPVHQCLPFERPQISCRRSPPHRSWPKKNAGDCPGITSLATRFLMELIQQACADEIDVALSRRIIVSET